MQRLHRTIALALIAVSPMAHAQLYGTSPFQNGPAPENGSLYVFDPDTLTWIDGQEVSLPGFFITGITGLTVHPTLAPPNDGDNGKLYAILKVSAVSGRVLATIDLATGVATQIGNLGDTFSSLSFREDGQLFGVTDDGASIPESLFLIDKDTAAKTMARSLGAGASGDIIAYNPVDDFFYHWSGDGTVVYERIMSEAPYLTTDIPVVLATSGETLGAVWDPCQSRTIGAVTRTGFIGSNINSRFNFWFADGTVSPSVSFSPDYVRGMALLGGYSCDADLGIGIGATDPSPTSGDPVTIDIVVDNAGEARAMSPTIQITLPTSITAATTNGCQEDPNGLPTCTPKIMVQRYETGAALYVPFPLSNLWKGRSVTVRVTGTYDGNAGDVVASTTSNSNETQAADNTNRFRLGDLLLRDSFE